MKKSRIIFLVTMLLVVASTCTVLGATASGTSHKFRQSYSEYYTGSKTEASFAGNSASSYTTITNKSDTNYYMEAMVRQYNSLTEDVQQARNTGTISPGKAVESGDLTRDWDNTNYRYVHKAVCYQHLYLPQGIVDSYEYTVLQTS